MYYTKMPPVMFYILYRIVDMHVFVNVRSGYLTVAFHLIIHHAIFSTVLFLQWSLFYVAI